MASELLKRVVKATLTNAETVLLNGVDGHTYTILSITFCETAAAAETFDLYIDIGGAGTDIEIYSDQALVNVALTTLFNNSLAILYFS